MSAPETQDRHHNVDEPHQQALSLSFAIFKPITHWEKC